MKKKSPKINSYENGFKFLERLIKNKSKGIIYKFDWILSDTNYFTSSIISNQNTNSTKK
jgi:hypothetical protein